MFGPPASLTVEDSQEDMECQNSDSPVSKVQDVGIQVNIDNKSIGVQVQPKLSSKGETMLEHGGAAKIKFKR